MFHSPVEDDMEMDSGSTNVGVRTPAPAPKSVAKCIDCEHFLIFKRCGRQYCGIGHHQYFPDKGDGCIYFRKGENPATRGEI